MLRFFPERDDGAEDREAEGAVVRLGVTIFSTSFPEAGAELGAGEVAAAMRANLSNTLPGLLDDSDFSSEEFIFAGEQLVTNSAIKWFEFEIAYQIVKPLFKVF